MKPRFVSFLGSMLVAASAAALSPATDSAQNSGQNSNSAQRDLGGNAERRLGELNREAQAGKLGPDGLVVGIEKGTTAQGDFVAELRSESRRLAEARHKGPQTLTDGRFPTM